ncbi:MAG: hypothetical protein C4293_10935 [Nitrospiraceae bacterium]
MVRRKHTSEEQILSRENKVQVLLAKRQSVTEVVQALGRPEPPQFAPCARVRISANSVLLFTC